MQREREGEDEKEEGSEHARLISGAFFLMEYSPTFLCGCARKFLPFQCIYVVNYGIKREIHVREKCFELAIIKIRMIKGKPVS